MNHPPIHTAPPLLQLLQWILDPLGFMDNCVDRYGDCFGAQLGSYRNFYFFSNPAAVEQIFTAGYDQFDAGRANYILRSTVGDHSLLLLDGDRHQRQRQLLMPPFHGERMRAYGHLIHDITEQVIRQWQVGKPFVVRPVMQSISMRVILQAVFGLNQGERCDQLRQLFNALLDLTTSRFGFAMAFFPILQRDYGAWSPGGKFLRFIQQIDQELYAEIRERREHPDPTRTDILSLLMAARDEAGQPMTDIELRDELVTLLLAGHETTATALTWALYWIHSLPEVQTKLLAELATLGSNLDPSAVVRLPYLNAVCSETLRIYPIAIITTPRIVKSPVHVMGYDFEPEMMLVPCIYLVHQRADLYPEPKQFKPERFLERQFSPYEFLPFGGSNRRCIGAAFALYEMKLALATILMNYELALNETEPVVPIRRGVTTAPKGGVRMVMTGRRATGESAPPLITSVESR